jgi:LysM repeat protein
MKRVAFILFTVLLVIALGACVRSKSPEEQLPAAEAEVAETTPAAEGDVLGQLETFVTQTAMAEQGESKAVEDETTEPGEEAEMPGSEETLPGEETPVEEQQPLEPTATPEVQVESQPTATPELVEAQPTTPPVEVPPPTPGIPKTHTIQRGESVFCISRRYNLNPSEVLSLNNLSASTILAPGQVLRIPQTGNKFPGNRSLNAHPDVYTVRGNESIHEVACFYGDVDPMVIAMVNNISAPYNLTAGQQLQIP